MLARRRELWTAAAPGVVTFAVLGSVGLADGGVFPNVWRQCALALLALAGVALLARERIVVSRAEWTAVCGLSAFAAWMALSSFWSGAPGRSLLESERAVVYAAGAAVVVLLVDEDSVRSVLAGALCAVTAIASYGLWIHTFTSPALDPFQGDLLYQPVGYANALGILVALGILLAVGLSLRSERPQARILALMPLLVLLPALVLTESRGAMLALVCGAFVLLRLDGRISVARTVVAAAVGLAAVSLAYDVSGVVGDNRVEYWRVALADFRDHPLVGSGAGTYVDYWLQAGEPSFTRTAHSLYLHTLAEIGVIGLALVSTALAAPLLAIRRARHQLTAAAAAAYVAFLAHAAVDWDWEMPVVTLTALVCGVGLLAANRPVTAGALSGRARAGLIALTLLLLLLVVVRFESGGSPSAA